ncbi:hypothetical protein OC835_003743 [Tilletia horrida]|nr:hypothetical protein OC835_003743 [Tilletia horrida]KAK0560280.1 hypothetical protein OC844_003875 [Tilletia horrida]
MERQERAPAVAIAVFLPPKDILKRCRNEARDEEAELSTRRVRYRRVQLEKTSGRRSQRTSTPVASTSKSRIDDDEPADDSRLEPSRSSVCGSARIEPTGAGRSATTAEEGLSLAPPPSFHFALNRITPIADILAHPERFAEDPDGPAFAPRPRLNLLVLVREVGPLEQYEPKNKGKAAVTTTARGGPSRWLSPALGYRSHLVVCDRDGSMLKISLWDRCARTWAEEEEEQDGTAAGGDVSRSRTARKDKDARMDGSLSRRDDPDASGSLSKSLTVDDSASGSASMLNEPPPRALRPGDVIYLTKLILSRPKDSTVADKSHKSGGGGNASTSLRRFISSASIQVSTTSESDVQLCFRSDVRARRDEAYAYIGPDRVVGSELRFLAEFDAHCRAVWQLVRRWF